MKVAGIKMDSEFDAVKLLQELSLLREELSLLAETISKSEELARDMEKLSREVRESRKVWRELERMKIWQREFWKKEKENVSELFSFLDEKSEKLTKRMEKRIENLEKKQERVWKKIIYPIFGGILLLVFLLGVILGWGVRDYMYFSNFSKTEKAQIFCTKKQCYLVVPLSKFEKNFEKEKKYLKK